MIPTTAIVFCIYVNDCLEKEPIPLLVALFAAGIVSAFVAALIPRHNLMMETQMSNSSENQSLAIETLFIISAVLGLCNSAYAATIKIEKK